MDEQAMKDVIEGIQAAKTFVARTELEIEEALWLHGEILVVNGDIVPLERD